MARKDSIEALIEAALPAVGAVATKLHVLAVAQRRKPEVRLQVEAIERVCRIAARRA